MSDRQQYRDALRNWDTMLADKLFSVPRHLGGVAIICSYQEWSRGSLNGIAPHDIADHPITFRDEALDLAGLISAKGRKVDVALDATRADMDQALRNPDISDVIVIGHGTLSELAVSYNGGTNWYDWRDVSSTADHLKQGQFVQRTCGAQARDLSVPLGLFAVTDHRNVIAPVGCGFAPTSLHHRDNDLLVPVTDMPRMNYRDVKRSFPHYTCAEDIPPAIESK